MDAVRAMVCTGQINSITNNFKDDAIVKNLFAKPSRMG